MMINVRSTRVVQTSSTLVVKNATNPIAISKRIWQWVMKMRTNKVAVMLQLKEIAFKLQFSDEHYFSNIFRDKMGVSPNYYRKQFQKGGNIP